MRVLVLFTLTAIAFFLLTLYNQSADISTKLTPLDSAELDSITPPNSLPEDLRVQWEQSPPELPADLQEQLDMGSPELPEDLREALLQEPRQIGVDEVNSPPGS